MSKATHGPKLVLALRILNDTTCMMNGKRAKIERRHAGRAFRCFCLGGLVCLAGLLILLCRQGTLSTVQHALALSLCEEGHGHSSGRCAPILRRNIIPACSPPKVAPQIFIGVFTTPDVPGTHAVASSAPPNSHIHSRTSYSARRQVLRATWFGTGRSTPEVCLKFVVGVTNSTEAEQQLEQEQVMYGDLLRLPGHLESYAGLSAKTRDFFLAVAEAHGCGSDGAPLSCTMPRWVIKVDDDVYVNLKRLVAASLQWSRLTAEYIGCMKHGVVWDEPGSRWYEPSHNLMGPRYYLHAYGSVYALAGSVVRDVIVRQGPRLRLLANEDTSVGAWMLAHDVQHFEDMRLCVPSCHPAGVVLQRTECAGLCEPLSEMVAAHNNTLCRDKDARPGWWEQGQGPPPTVKVWLPNSTVIPAPLWVTWRESVTPFHEASNGSKVGPAVSKVGPANPDPNVPWSWWEMTQVLPGELPFLPNHPEHTFFQAMWV